ncbi:MAG: T9SS type A sorting domain-containing protein, partial [Bacteroidetes bacterium]|nr:T9SS type A sorting domain-containing protein [Bacteroidota bacterium]
YYLQVYTYTSTPLQTSTFDVCVGTDPTLFPPDCEGVPGGPAVPGTPCFNEQFQLNGTWTQNCLCQPNVGIEEIAAERGIALSPNPASTELYLTVPDGRTVSVKIYDLLGHLVMEEAMTKHISIAHLAPGTYTLIALNSKAEQVGHARFVKR